MNKLDFFTPVRYDGQEKNIKHQEKNIKHHIFEGIEDYFSLEGKLLQEGIDINDGTVSKVKSCMKTILQRKEEGGVHLYNSTGNHRVFSLDTEPGLVFKMNDSKNVQTLRGGDSMIARYQIMISAKTVCRTHELGLLVIPNAKLFTVNADGEDYDIIAEKKVDINPDESSQEELFEEHADSLNETIRQLTVFIAKTGFSDVEWRNIPVLNDSQDENGNRKIALIDIEEMSSPATGLFGGFLRRGLVECVNEEQGEIVVNEAKKHLSWSSSLGESAERSLKRRKAELESGKQLKQFYETKGIVSGKEPIQVDVDSLGLDLTEEGQIDCRCRGQFSKLKWEKKTVTLRDVAEEVIAKMNSLIQQSADGKSVKGKRYFVLGTNAKPFNQYLNLPSSKFFITEEAEKQLWLRRIIQALIDKAHIFKLDKINGHGYFVQA